MSVKEVLAVGIEEACLRFLYEQESALTVEKISTREEFEKLFERTDLDRFNFVVVGPECSQVDIQEVAQGLRNIFALKKIFYLSNQRSKFLRSAYIKNGFDEAFLLGFDRNLIKEELQSLLLEKIKLKPIKLSDIEPGSTLDFNLLLFFPKNKKYLKYLNAGEVLTQERYDRISGKDLGMVFIPENEMSKFYLYTAERLRKLKSSSTISDTERREKMQESVRNIFSTLFEDRVVTDFAYGKQIIEECKKMISAIVSVSGSEDWIDSILRSIQNYGSDMYTHCMNVSIYATLFALALDVEAPDDFVIAGLFHDLGNDLGHSEETSVQLSPDELHYYQQHPHRSVDLLKEKKVITNERVQKMILQHHERLDKTGFPNKIEIDKFTEDAQIFAIANQIETICQVKEGEKRSNLEEVFARIEGTGHYSLEVMRRLRKAIFKK